MLEAIALDSKTLIIKSDKEIDLIEVIDFISKKSKKESINKLFAIGDKNKVLDKNFKFDRGECYISF